MNATESLNSASIRAGVSVFSVAHKRVSHDHDHDHDLHTTSRLQSTRERVCSLPQGHPGHWRTPVAPGKTPTVHLCPKGKALGSPHETTSDRRQNDTDKRQYKRAFSETGIDCTGQVLTHTWNLTKWLVWSRSNLFSIKFVVSLARLLIKSLTSFLDLFIIISLIHGSVWS